MVMKELGKIYTHSDRSCIEHGEQKTDKNEGSSHELHDRPCSSLATNLHGPSTAGILSGSE